MGKSTLLSVVLLIFLGSCAGSSAKKSTPLGPNMKARWIPNLQQAAAKETGCPPDQHVYRNVSPNREAMDGCGRTAEFTLARIGMATSWMSLGELKNRGSFEMGCPAEALTVVELGGSVWGLQGCGKRATYVATFTGGTGSRGMFSFTWVRNSGSAQSGNAPAAN